MKYNELMKRVVTESGLIAGTTLIAFGVLYFLSGMKENYETQIGVLRREADVLEQETTSLQEKFSKVQQNAGLYQEALEKQSQGSLSITRQGVRDKFNQLNEEYFLGNLRLTMSGIEPLSGPNYQRTNGTIVSSDVSVNFEAVSDEHIYEMINAMMLQLPGTAKITRISMQRQRTLSDDILRVISQKGSFPLVVCEVRFQWFGIRSPEGGAANAADTSR
jgi:uncharacterized protein YlxW (UPF0749 family)